MKGDVVHNTVNLLERLPILLDITDAHAYVALQQQ